MKILIADKFEESGRNGLEAIGASISYQPDLKDESLIASIQQIQPSVLIVRSTKVSGSALQSGPIQLVVRAGAGYNNIDIATASRLGIYVANCPGKNSIAVAELTFALILALDRRIVDNVVSLRAGKWNKKEFSKAEGLFGKTLGLIGVGSIGKEMIPRAHAFGMNVVGWSRSLTREEAAELGIGYKESIVEVARASNIVSCHLALNEETHSILSNQFFEAMREGAYFINSSRGEIVDQTALMHAIKTKNIRVGLDVYQNEPTSSTGEFIDAIANEPNLYGTHHIGASTNQAQEAIAAETVRIIKVYKETGKVPNVVNIAKHSPATHVLVVRHLDRPGVLAQVLDAIKGEQINVQEMENTIFEGAEAAVARINLDNAPSSKLLEELKKSSANIIDLSLLEFP
jgi:D-3-phosphoglycerate dehydrogenase / 2-oxoglutarate reductase